MENGSNSIRQRIRDIMQEFDCSESAKEVAYKIADSILQETDIYVVMESSGEYDTRTEIPVKSFLDEESATSFADYLNDKQNAEEERYLDALEKFNVGTPDEIFEMIFSEYLKDTDADYYQKYTEAKNDINIDFNWDKFYDRLDDFQIGDKEEPAKYLTRCGYDIDSIEDILFAKNYYDSGKSFEKPYYYVHAQPIKLNYEILRK